MISEYRGWVVYVQSAYDEDGNQYLRYSAWIGRELKRKFMRPPYVPVPEFETVDEIRKWIDDDAPYKLPV